jgi:hypothetical protein
MVLVQETAAAGACQLALEDLVQSIMPEHHLCHQLPHEFVHSGQEADLKLPGELLHMEKNPL